MRKTDKHAETLHAEIRFSADEKAKIAHLAKRLLQDEPALLTSLDFGENVQQGVGDGPSLIIGDQAEIALLSNAVQSRFDYRMAVLAQRDDIVVVRQREPEFERYISEYLGRGHINFLEAMKGNLSPVAIQFRASAHLGYELVRKVEQGEGLTLVPYLTTGNIWRLAQSLGEAGGQIIHVNGPSPRLARRVNDKLWFANLARGIIGSEATPPTLAAFGPAGAAGLVVRLARRSSHVVVKVPDSAGSAGNIKLDSANLAELSMNDVRRFLLERLQDTGWQGRYPILVGVWEDDVICSPSVQLWVPQLKSGPPISEAIFEQKVQGSEGTFVGAVKSTLPKELQEKLTHEAVKITAVLQRIGYFGRCSLDAVISSPNGGATSIHWIECNGRWGGVSIPMTAGIRLMDGKLPEGLVVVQEKRPDLPALSTSQSISRLTGLLFHRYENHSGIVLLSPSEANIGRSINFMATAPSQAEADVLSEGAVQRLRKP